MLHSKGQATRSNTNLQEKQFCILCAQLFFFATSKVIVTPPIKHFTSSITYLLLLDEPQFNTVNTCEVFLNSVLMTNLSLPSDLWDWVPRHAAAEWFQMEEVCSGKSFAIKGSPHFMFHPTQANLRQTGCWLFSFCDVLQQISKSFSVSVRIEPIIHASGKDTKERFSDFVP